MSKCDTGVGPSVPASSGSAGGEGPLNSPAVGLVVGAGARGESSAKEPLAAQAQDNRVSNNGAKHNGKGKKRSRAKPNPTTADWSSCAGRRSPMKRMCNFLVASPSLADNGPAAIKAKDAPGGGAVVHTAVAKRHLAPVVKVEDGSAGGDKTKGRETAEATGVGRDNDNKKKEGNQRGKRAVKADRVLQPGTDGVGGEVSGDSTTTRHQPNRKRGQVGAGAAMGCRRVSRRLQGLDPSKSPRVVATRYLNVRHYCNL